MNCIKLTSLQILREQIAATREELSFSLTAADLEELLPHSKTKIGDMLRKYDYPEADPEEVIPNRKIGGRRVVPRDWFLSWYYGEGDKKTIEGESGRIYKTFKEGDGMIDEKKLFDKLQTLEKKHRNIQTEKLDTFYNDKSQQFYYEQGFADGIQQAMNEIVSLLDEERLKKMSNGK